MNFSLIVLEGPDGTGKTTHAQRLAARLTLKGHRASAFHHRGARDKSPFAAALEYAAQRQALAAAASANEVIVADRWWHSSYALGIALTRVKEGPEGYAMRDLALVEAQMVPVPTIVFRLDAGNAHLDARLAARGTPTTDLDRAVRAVYRELSVPHTTVPTDIDHDTVDDGMLALALSALDDEARFS